jgi:AraC-like DNA-binding protein
MLHAFESYTTSELIGYTKQEDYIKINFWLSGRHTTVLDGFGQVDSDRPEVLITAGPWEMVKIDLCNRNTQISSLAICLVPDFFIRCMRLDLDELPQPFRGLVRLAEMPPTLHRLSFTPDLIAATRAILAAPPAVRCQPIYIEAKAVELMCLLVNRLKAGDRKAENGDELGIRRESQIHEARDLIAQRYAEDITLELVSRTVGLNKMALTHGFRQLFGMSVYDCLQRVRMERAYELLRNPKSTVGSVADAVGYRHSCNFSTAFRAYFGCTPQNSRRERG